MSSYKYKESNEIIPTLPSIKEINNFVADFKNNPDVLTK